MIDDDGDDLSSAPLPPDDRLWRHPSELATAPRRPSTRRPLATIGVVSSLAGAAAAVVALTALGVFSPGAVEERDLSATPTSTATTAPPPTTVASARAVARSVAASVVEVTATAADGTVRRASGVVARSDGLILTSARLISGAGTVAVTLPSGRREEARIEGVDELTGLAAVSVTGAGLPTAILDISPPRLGEQAIMVSARSAGARPTVVDGRVSATGTHVTAGDDVLVGLIETDTPIPADADGGALVDGAGNLRGVCLSLSGQGGAGWAVPTEVALRVADDLRRLGRVDRGWLGVSGEPAAADGGVPAGFAVSALKPGSPAEAAGVLPGDVLISVDDHRVRSLDDVRSSLTLTRPGQTVTLELNRGDQTLELPVLLQSTPAE